MRKNTAPCIAYACHKIASIEPDANIIIAPSDHLMLNEEKFLYVLLEALEYTENMDVLVTLGIKPSRPDTGYGYIQFDETVVHRDIHKVKTFTEKPDMELARTFIKAAIFFGIQAFLFGMQKPLWRHSINTNKIFIRRSGLPEGFWKKRWNSFDGKGL